MIEQVKFLSPEWEKLMKDSLKAEFCKKGGVTTEFMQVVEGCPDGTSKWMLFKIKKSTYVSYEVGEGEQPEAEFKAFAPYEIFQKVILKELDGSKALINGKFKLKGNMMKAMGLIGIYNRVEKVQRAIPTIF
ncbi:hypothetical protein SH2C18_51720 [Clostridium sediminicola]|uniref:SCP2 sterol-binding domain-containing protein n=1 Tax=Clostridium sediminicola TaxID=3114879 RepID=UPI0031F21A11